MKLKKRIAAGISWRRTITAPMIRKIQRAVPAPLNSMDRAKAGVASNVTATPANPAFSASFFLDMSDSSLLV
jgi:hypothetical protein